MQTEYVYKFVPKKLGRQKVNLGADITTKNDEGEILHAFENVFYFNVIE